MKTDDISNLNLENNSLNDIVLACREKRVAARGTV